MRETGEQIALEVNGQHDFSNNTRVPTGSLISRHRLLMARGWAVIHVPIYLWAELTDAVRGAWLLQARHRFHARDHHLCRQPRAHAQGLSLKLSCPLHGSCVPRCRMHCTNQHEMRCAGQEIQRARELQAAAAALPPGAPRPVLGFADVAAALAPQRLLDDVLGAARAAGLPIPEHLATQHMPPGSALGVG